MSPALQEPIVITPHDPHPLQALSNTTLAFQAALEAQAAAASDTTVQVKDGEAPGEDGEAKEEEEEKVEAKDPPILADDEEFTKILDILERHTHFNLDNFRDPYLMREGKKLRALITPRVLELYDQGQDLDKEAMMKLVDKYEELAKSLEELMEEEEEDEEAMSDVALGPSGSTKPGEQLNGVAGPGPSSAAGGRVQ